MLILAREEVVAALLGLMVEVSGFQPKFADNQASAENAIREDRFHAVLIDCDHREFSEKLIGLVRSSGARPILFSPFRLRPDVTQVAQRNGAESFTLPTDPESFARILTG